LRLCMKKRRESSLTNPLLKGLKIPVQRRTKYRSGVLPGSDGQRSVRMMSDARVDIMPYVKLFRPGIDVIPKMSEPGRKVFTLLLASMLPHKDQVCMTYADFVAVTGIKSASTMSKGLQNLAALGMIAPTEHRGIYFINPMMLFSGNRLKLFSALGE